MAEALRYKDKVTIITGGSKGIGKGCVEVFGKSERLLTVLWLSWHSRNTDLLDIYVCVQHICKAQYCKERVRSHKLGFISSNHVRDIWYLWRNLSVGNSNTIENKRKIRQILWYACLLNVDLTKVLQYNHGYIAWILLMLNITFLAILILNCRKFYDILCSRSMHWTKDYHCIILPVPCVTPFGSFLSYNCTSQSNL